MARREPLGNAGAVLLAGIAGLLWLLFAARPREPGAEVFEARTLIIQPVVFVGMVEVTADDEYGRGLRISTATEQVLLADNEVSRMLVEFVGELVAVRGELIETSRAPPTMVVRDFQVLGEGPPPQPPSEPGSPAREPEIAC